MSINLQGVIFLLLFIAPGFLFSQSYLASRPRYYRQPDVFEQTVLSAVGSVLIHVCLTGILAGFALLYRLLSGHSPLTGEILASRNSLADYPLHVLAGYTLAAAIYLLLSLLLARRLGLALGKIEPEQAPRWYVRLLGQAPPGQVLLWYTALYEEPLRRGVDSPRLVAWLRNGERFEGDLATLRLAGGEGNTVELALNNASYTPASASATKQVKLKGQTVLLRSDDILWLSRIDGPRNT
jgi:hypothetical protein